MPIARSVLDELRPRRGEAEIDYAARASALLPGWPEDVLLQWPYWHPDAFATFAQALPLERATFQLKQWQTSHLPGREVYLDEEDFEAVTECARKGGADSCRALQCVWRHMTQRRTWPRPIIVMTTAVGEPFLIPHPTKVFVKTRRPLTLLEGHRRLALAHVLRERGELTPTVPVWMVAA